MSTTQQVNILNLFFYFVDTKRLLLFQVPVNNWIRVRALIKSLSFAADLEKESTPSAL